MNSVDLKENLISKSFNELAESLPKHCLRLRVLAKNHQDQMKHSNKLKVLIIEDSSTCMQLLRETLRNRLPEVEIVEASSWMQASPHIMDAKFVVIDWTLPDGVTAIDCGALELLDKLKIKHLIFTAFSPSVPNVNCPVVDKSNVDLVCDIIEKEVVSQVT